MSDAGQGVWFRRQDRGLGANYVPVSWQGWLLTLGLTPVLLATIFAADPATIHTTNPALLHRMRAWVGLSGAHLAVPVIVVLVIAEVAAFVGIVLWTSRPIRPLD